MKIVSTGKTISSPEFYQQKLKARRQKLIWAGALLLVLLVAAVFILRLEKLRISRIWVSGAVVTGAEPVAKVVAEELRGHYLWLIPRASSTLYPRSRIIALLEEKFPRLQSIDLALQNSQELSVTVVEREPAALYCSGVTCFFLDSQGFIFDTAPVFSEGVYFTFQTETPLENPQGRQLLEVEDFQKLSRFLSALRDLGAEPEKLEMKSDEYRLTLEGGAALTWPYPADYDLIYSNLETFLSNEALGERGEFWARIAELDLRTGNKVFYKFREQI